MARAKIKICGLTNRHDAELAIEHGADALGCICTPQSKRHQTPQQLTAIFTDLPPFVTRVVVVVNPDTELLKQLSDCPIDYIQFHGEEPHQHTQASPLPWYKAVKGVSGYQHALANYPNSQAILVDSPAGGGTGQPWNWDQLPPPSQRDTPLILAGGLNPNNVRNAITKVKPWAVDVSSGIEQTPDKKDPALLKHFINLVMQTHW